MIITRLVTLVKRKDIWRRGLKEHRSDLKKHASLHSVVSKHRVCNGHDFDWDGVKILHNEHHWKKRDIAEMCYIKRNNMSINLQKDTDNLSMTYDSVLGRGYSVVVFPFSLFTVYLVSKCLCYLIC